MTIIELTNEAITELTDNAKKNAISVTGELSNSFAGVFSEIMRASVSIYITQAQLDLQRMAVPDFSQLLTPKDNSAAE